MIDWLKTQVSTNWIVVLLILPIVLAVGYNYHKQSEAKMEATMKLLQYEIDGLKAKNAHSIKKTKAGRLIKEEF